MKLWRLTRAPFAGLDGKGAELHGARYAPPVTPVVSLASEAGLAVLVALRYLTPDLIGIPVDFVLGWTDIDGVPLRIDDKGGEDAIRTRVTLRLETRPTLLAAIRSKVLPDADVIYLNPLHPEAVLVRPLTTRPFDFAEWLHRPPMLENYRSPA